MNDSGVTDGMQAGLYGSAHKKGGVVLSAYHATQGRRIVDVYCYDIPQEWFAGRAKIFLC